MSIRFDASKAGVRRGPESSGEGREANRVLEGLLQGLNAFGDGVAILGSDWRIRHVNPVGAQILGLPVDRLISRDIRTAVPHLQESRLAEALREVLDQGQARQLEPALEASGRHFNTGVYPLEDGLLVLWRVITEGREEDEVGRGQLAAIVESSDDAIFSENLEGIITSWNGGAERLFGYTADDAIGRPVSMLVVEDHPDEIAAITEHLRRDERLNQYETILQTKEGCRYDVSLTVLPIRGKEGQTVGGAVMVRDTTERTRAERTLAHVIDEAERQKRLYETILSNTPDLVYVFDLNYRFTYANQALLAMWGRSWEEAIGKSLLEIGYEPWHAEMHERELDQVVATKEPVRGEVPFPHHELGRRIYDYIFVPILRPDGGIEAIAGTTRDVTEYRQAEEALRRSEEQRRVALDAARMGTWASDADEDAVFLDRWASELLGLEGRREVTRQGLLACIHEDDRERVDREIEAALSSGGDSRFDSEHRVRLQTGTYRWVHAVGRAEFEAGERGRPVRFIGVVFDTTEAHNAWEAMEEANERAEHQLAQLQAIVGQMIEGLMILDPEGNVLSMNQAALAAHDFVSVEEARTPLHGLTELFEAFDLETGRRLSLEEWAPSRALRGETFSDFECRVHNKHSNRTWIASCGGTPIWDEEGQVQLAIVTMRDITERKQGEEQLIQLNETLEQRVAEQTAQARQRADQLQRLAAELTEVEQRERRRLAQLLHDDLQQILVAAKMRLPGDSDESGVALTEAKQLLGEAINTSRSLSTELTPPVLYDLGLDAAVEWLSRWVKDKYALDVEVTIDGSEPAENEPLRALLFEAVRELLLNVVKHANVDEARITLERREGELHVTVEDFGVGFDPVAHRAEADHDQSGYGLFSLRERLELSGGQVGIDSAPGKGTRVEIAVPLMRSPQAALEEPSREPERGVEGREESVAAAAAEPCTRVLLVDDHDVVRRGLANLVGQQVTMQVVAEAATGEEAVDLARSHRPDVVVMDISLPGISGIEATRRIVEESPEICVIGLSIYEARDVADALHRAGAAAFFNKSEAAGELVQAIRRLVPGRQQ